jgi:hypothetical protein
MRRYVTRFLPRPKFKQSKNLREWQGWGLSHQVDLYHLLTTHELTVCRSLAWKKTLKNDICHLSLASALSLFLDVMYVNVMKPEIEAMLRIGIIYIAVNHIIGMTIFDGSSNNFAVAEMMIFQHASAILT